MLALQKENTASQKIIPKEYCQHLCYKSNFKGSFNLISNKKGVNTCFNVLWFPCKIGITLIMLSAPDEPKYNPRVLWAGYYTSGSPLDCCRSLYPAATEKRVNTPE